MTFLGSLPSSILYPETAFPISLPFHLVHSNSAFEFQLKCHLPKESLHPAPSRLTAALPSALLGGISLDHLPYSLSICTVLCGRPVGSDCLIGLSLSRAGNRHVWFGSPQLPALHHTLQLLQRTYSRIICQLASCWVWPLGGTRGRGKARIFLSFALLGAVLLTIAIPPPSLPLLQDNLSPQLKFLPCGLFFWALIIYLLLSSLQLQGAPAAFANSELVHCFLLAFLAQPIPLYLVLCSQFPLLSCLAQTP